MSQKDSPSSRNGNNIHFQETPVRKNNRDFKTLANNLRLLIGSAQEGEVIKKGKEGLRDRSNSG